jgi:hypothetical protein
LNGPLVENGGALDFDAGVLVFAGSSANQSIGAGSLLGTSLTLDAARRVELAGTLQNHGLLRGDGTIALACTNGTGGEVRAESGKFLAITGPNGPNAGRLNLQGGTLGFSQNFTCAATGQINGHGILFFPTTGTGAATPWSFGWGAIRHPPRRSPSSGSPGPGRSRCTNWSCRS